MAHRLPHLPFVLQLLCCGWLLVCPGAAQRAKPEAAKTPPPGRVSGRVTYADTGHPVRRAWISLYSLALPTDDASTELRHSIEISDFQGAFTFEDVPPGRYAVVVSGKNLVDFGAREGVTLSDAPMPAEVFDGWFPVFTVKAGETVAVKVTARRGGVIAGRVTNADGTPAATASLTLLRRQTDGKTEAVNLRNSPFTADAQGIYRIAGLPAGEYLVRAADRDTNISTQNEQSFMRNAGRLYYAFHPTGRKLKDATPVKVQEGVETPDVDIVLPEVSAYTLAGTVTLKGAPVTKANVSVTYQDAETKLPISPVSTVSDDNGHWEIFGLPDGNYKISLALYAARLFGDKENTVNALPLEKEVAIAGADQLEVKLELKSGGRVAGVTEVAAGEERDGTFMMSLYRVNEKDGSNIYSDNNRVYVGVPGPFEANKLEAGQYRWYTGDPDFYPLAVLRGDKDISDEPFRLEAGEEITGLRLILASDFVTVTGRVVSEGKTRQPVPAARVLALPVTTKKLWRPFNYDSEANDQGEFELKLPPGEYYFIALTEFEWNKLDDGDAYFAELIKKAPPQMVRMPVNHKAKMPKLTLTGIKTPDK